MKRYPIRVVGNTFQIDGFDDASKLVAVSGLTPELERTLADYTLHLADLRSARACIDHLCRPETTEPVIRDALWQSAIMHYTKCFDQSAKVRTMKLAVSDYLPEGLPREIHEYFRHMRNKHLVHDENAYTDLAVGAVLAQPGSVSSVLEVIAVHIEGNTLEDANIRNLSNLITSASAWVDAELERTYRAIRSELEGQPYEVLTRQPAMRPYRAPEAEDMAKRRPVP